MSVGTQMTKPSPAKKHILRLGAGLVVSSLLVTLFATYAVAQGGFSFELPWDEPEVRPEPRPQPRQAPPRGNDDWAVDTQPGDEAGGGWTARSDICLRLEQQLVRQSRQGNQGRSRLPQIEADIRAANRAWRRAENQLERRNCFEYFLFSKSIRRTRRCVKLANASDAARRKLAQLQGEKQRIQSASRSSYQDDVIRELARNGCGQQYAQEARRRDRNIFSGFWGDDEGGSGYGNNYNRLPFATYRTLCVRMCDGYYFPVSFSTLPSHFQRDSDVCRSKCAAPAKLFYYQNPGGAIGDMVDAETNEPYNQLKTAFLYRKKYIDGCSCKVAEYKDQTPIPEGALPGEASPDGAPQPPDAPPAQKQDNDDFNPGRRASAGAN